MSDQTSARQEIRRRDHDDAAEAVYERFDRQR